MAIDEVGDYAIIDRKRLITCMTAFAGIRSLEDSRLLSIATDSRQISHVATRFDFTWTKSAEIDQQELLHIYTRLPKPKRLDRSNKPQSVAETVDQILRSPQDDQLPIDSLIDPSYVINSALLPASLAELARKSLERRYRDALASYADVLEHASESAALLEKQQAIHTEIAERFLRRLTTLLASDNVPPELAVAIRHPSIKLSNRAIYRTSRKGGWPIITAFGSDITYDFDDQCLERLGYGVWKLCLALLAIDVGIVQRFGVEAGAHFVSRCCDPHLIQSQWDALDLGPLLVRHTYKTTENDIKRAFYQLTALLFKHIGITRCLSFIKSACDPLVILGDDVASIVAYKDAKTFLQELLQANGGVAPTYLPKRAPDSPDHDPTWTCVLSVGTEMKAEGTAASKQDAELKAADRMLATFRSSPRWSKRVDEFVGAEIQKLVRNARPPIFTKIHSILGLNGSRLKRQIQLWSGRRRRRPVYSSSRRVGIAALPGFRVSRVGAQMRFARYSSAPPSIWRQLISSGRGRSCRDTRNYPAIKITQLARADR